MAENKTFPSSLKIFLLLLFTEAATSVVINNESVLVAHLLKGYDPLPRPVLDPKESIECRFQLELMQILEVNGKNNILVSNIRLRVMWTDANFIWNPADFGNVSEIKVPSTQIWHPDVLLYNTATNNKEFQQNTEVANALIFSAGAVIHIPSLNVKSTCVLDARWFPFDEQVCSLMFGSWTYSAKQLNLDFYQEGLETSDYVEHGEWALLGTEASILTKFYPEASDEYKKLVYKLRLRRRSLYYLYNLLVPCGLIGFLALLGFTLPPDSKERLTLGVTVLFSLITFLNMISTLMPTSSSGIPLLGAYFSCVMVTIAMSTISCVVVNLCDRSTEPKKSSRLWDKFLSPLFLKYLPILLRMRTRPPPEKKEAVPSIEEEKEEIKFLALVVDRACLCISGIFALIMSIVMLQTS